MAFRMKRSAPNDNKPEPMRKRRKLNQLFDIDDVAALSKKAEISISRSLTADEKRIEIGKRVLAAAQQKLNDNNDQSSDDDDIDMNNDDDDIKISNKDAAVHDILMKQIGEKEGKYRYRIASKLRSYIDNNPLCPDIVIKTFRGHRLSVTCMALDPSGSDSFIITGSKDGSIIKWDLNTGKKIKKIWHAWPINNRNKINKKTGKKLKWGGLSYQYIKKIRPKPVLALAISYDSKWLVSGGEDCLIRVWNLKTMRYKSTFRGGHQSKITGLAFSRDNNVRSSDDTHNTLFSTGYDRQIRVYDMNEMGFAEPLYGHTLGINNIDTTSDDKCLTVSDDKTIRYWKLRTQSQLIFNNGHDSTIDACCIITPSSFITGSQDGSIALWSTTKKNPLHKEINVHLSNNKLDITHKSKLKHWIVSLSAKHNCDVFASGSSDGVVKLFAVRGNRFTHLRSIRIPKGGFINVIKWSEKGDKIICGIGTEHRLGRWDSIQGAKNGIAIIKLPFGCCDNPVNPINNNNNNIKFNKTENWGKWDPREKGEFYINDKKDKNQNQNQNNNNNKNNNLDNKNDEWTNFFKSSSFL